MIKEFREFIARGNVMDLAVGIIIGAAFTAIVNSLVSDLINPFIGLLTGGVDFSSHVLRFGEGEDAATFRYGAFITAVINFLVIAWVVFLLVKAMNRLRTMVDTTEKAPDAPGPTQEEVLIEIRDLLRARSEPLPPRRSDRRCPGPNRRQSSGLSPGPVALRPCGGRVACGSPDARNRAAPAWAGAFTRLPRGRQARHDLSRTNRAGSWRGHRVIPKQANPYRFNASFCDSTSIPSARPTAA